MNQGFPKKIIDSNNKKRIISMVILIMFGIKKECFYGYFKV